MAAAWRAFFTGVPWKPGYEARCFGVVLITVTFSALGVWVWVLISWRYSGCNGSILLVNSSWWY
jgi:hypothetical protein